MRTTVNTNEIYTRLTDPKYQETLSRLLGDIVIFNQTEDAFWFARNLETTLNEHREFAAQQPTLYQTYRQMVVTADWVALPLLPEARLLKLFQENLKTALMLEDFDLTQALKTQLISILLLDERDKFKVQLRRALEQNEEPLTNDMITVNNQPLSSTIGHWLLAYITHVGTQPVATVKLTEFLFSNRDVTRLNTVQRQALEKLLRLYEKLKLSSQTPEGIEERIPVDDPENPGTLVNGTFQPQKIDENEFNVILQVIATAKNETASPFAAPAPIPISVPKAAAAQPLAPLPMDERITEAENTLLAETEGDVPKLQSALFVALKTNKTNQSIAVLLVLARLGGLRDMLMQNKDLANIYEKNVVPALTKQLSIDAPKVTKTYTPAHLREFIRFILTRALGNEAESARYGAQIEAVMQSTGAQEYANMTYFEPREGTYRWAQAQVDEQGNLQ